MQEPLGYSVFNSTTGLWLTDGRLRESARRTDQLRKPPGFPNDKGEQQMRKYLALAVCVSLAGCATSPNRIKPAAVDAQQYTANRCTLHPIN